MKSLGLILFGALAVLSGVVVTILLIRKRRKETIVDFDDFETVVSDEEFEHFFGGEGGSKADEETED